MRTFTAAFLALVIALPAVPGQAAEELRLPQSADVTACSSDLPSGGLNHWKNLLVTCPDVIETLAQAKVVSEAKWKNEFSHVAGGDRYGHLLLSDGTRLRWMVRPGGLEWLEWPSGQRLYLMVCCNATSPSK
jgi:hypothetical protein